MLNKLTHYVWMIVLILVAYPCTSLAGSATLSAGEIWKEPVTGMEFVWVPGGCYEMGCGNWTSDCARDEKPVHEVCVDGFWMGKTEVTQEQWKQVMGENPSEFKKGDNYPVENAIWAEMEKFTMKLSSLNKGAYKFRFPTEAEWEYACRAVTGTRYYTGDKEKDLIRAGWYRENSGEQSHPVSEKEPNAFGLYDMHGNVWEWVEDDWHYNYDGAPIDGTAWIDEPRGAYRVVRGGNWSGPAWRCRSAFRIDGAPVGRGNGVGFRLARSVTLGP